MKGKVGTVGLIAGLWLLSFGTLVAQQVQTDSSTLAGDLQTPSATLETVISVVEANPYVSDKNLQVLSAFLATAIEQGAVTPEQALQLLDAVGWTELTEEDAVGFAVRALELALIAVTADGAAYDEVLAELTQMAESGKLGPLAAGDHSLNALPGLAKALLGAGGELTPDLLEEIEDAALSGVPPGQIARLVKALAREGADEEEIIEALEGLADQVEEGVPPGQAWEHGGKGGKGHADEGDEEMTHGPSPGQGGDEEDDEEIEHGPANPPGGGPPSGKGKDEDDDDDDEGHGHGKRKGKNG